MAALTKARNTTMRQGDMRETPVAASVRIFKGALLMRDTDGNIKPGATETGAVGIGRAEEAADNSGGAAGDLTAKWRAGVFQFGNSAGADEIDASDIGTVCYIVDDQTVAATDATGTRSKAGIVEDLDAGGVWVRFDEALTRAS